MASGWYGMDRDRQRYREGVFEKAQLLRVKAA